MSGRISGEVWSLAKQLREHGATQRAVNVLAVIAERCYDDSRSGPCSRARIAEAQGVTERTVTRALTLLVSLGLITVVSAGGGRGRLGIVTIYEMPDLHAWVAARRRAAEGPPGWDETAGSAGHLDDPPEPVPQPPRTPPARDPGDIGDASAGHPGVARSVVPVGNSSLEVPTGAQAIARPPGWRPSPRPRTAAAVAAEVALDPPLSGVALLHAELAVINDRVRRKREAAGGDRRRAPGRVRAGLALDERLAS